MPLIPNLTPDQRNLLVNRLVPESRVNGFWIAALGQYFPTPNYLINAEEHVTSAHRPDLYITQLQWAPAPPQAPTDVHIIPVAVFEGKGSTSSDNFSSIRTQLMGYGKATTDAEGIPGVYCIGAKGQKVSFWYFKKGDMIEMKPLLASRTGVIVKDSAEMPPELHVLNDFVAIDNNIRFILNNPSPPITR
ncbi:hypothetical protein FRC11_008297 [Ceratobasidium sp. 423]|nr:hypothetical protein FRC11_008297 [Ceratobasidium sp. 423]